MTDLCNYTGVFSALANVEDGSRVYMRNRRPVSCLVCRMRKLNCDRQRPCGSCAIRGDGASCEFIARGNLGMRRHEEKSRSEAQARLQRLEQMVHGLIQSSTTPV
jgi:hypothetical protein